MREMNTCRCTETGLVHMHATPRWKLLGTGGGDLAGAKFRTAKCGTAKLYHILPWYLRTEATFLPLPNLCTFSLHYKVPRV